MDWLIKAARRPIGAGYEVGKVCNRMGCEGVMAYPTMDYNWIYHPYGTGLDYDALKPACPTCGHVVK